MNIINGYVGVTAKNDMFCFPCLLFSGDVVWTKIGVVNLKHITDKINKHEDSSTHLKNVMGLAKIRNSKYCSSAK